VTTDALIGLKNAGRINFYLFEAIKHNFKYIFVKLISMKSLIKKFEFTNDLKPICPYCEKEIDIEEFLEGGPGMHQKISTIKVMMKPSIFMTTTFFCPHCRKILGVSKNSGS